MRSPGSPARRKTVVQMPLAPAAPQPAAAPKPAAPAQVQKQQRTEERTLEARIARLEKSIAEQQRIQTRLNNELFAVHQRIAGTQDEAQKIQDQVNATGQKLSAGEAELASLRDQLAARQSRVQPAPGAPASAAAAPPEGRRVKEQDILLRQKDEEIRDLRAAVAARDELLKEQSKTGEATPAPGSGLRPPAPVASTKPAMVQTQAVPRAAVAAPPASTGRVSRFSFLPHFGRKEKTAPAKKAVMPPGSLSGEQAALLQLIEDGKRQLRGGNTAEAEKLFLQALEKNPALLSAQTGLASCRYAAGDLANAKRLVNGVLMNDPRNAQALGLSGVIAWREGHLNAARDALKKAIGRDPKNAQWHSYLGIVLYQQGQLRPAQKQLERAVALNPNLAEAHFNLAVIFTAVNPPKADQARKHYETALRLGSAPDERLDRILNPQGH